MWKSLQLLSLLLVVVIAVTGLAPVTVHAQNKPAILPPWSEGPFSAFQGVYRGPDYRLTIWSDGSAVFTHDDGSIGQIIFEAQRRNPQYTGRGHGMMAFGRVRTMGASTPPLSAIVAFQNNLTNLKGDAAFLGVFLDAPGNPVVFTHRVCEPIVGNGAWEVYPC